MSHAANVDEGDDRDGGENLPARLSAKERHQARLDADMHPTIEMDDSVWGDVRNGVDGGVYIDDGDRLIGFMERNRCPVCGKRGSVKIDNSFTFVYGATNHATVDGERKSNEVIERLEKAGERPLYCTAGRSKYYIGVVSASAYEAYSEWRDTENERVQFRKRARALVDSDVPEDLLAGGYDQGHLLAAIYEELDCESYDERELMGRSHVTKGQLAVILTRLKSLDTREKRSYTENDWLTVADFGITQAGVEWHVPEWVDFDGLRYSDQFRTRLFD